MKQVVDSIQNLTLKAEETDRSMDEIAKVLSKLKVAKGSTGRKTSPVRSVPSTPRKGGGFGIVDEDEEVVDVKPVEVKKKVKMSLKDIVGSRGIYVNKSAMVRPPTLKDLFSGDEVCGSPVVARVVELPAEVMAPVTSALFGGTSSKKNANVFSTPGSSSGGLFGKMAQSETPNVVPSMFENKPRAGGMFGIVDSPGQTPVKIKESPLMPAESPEPRSPSVAISPERHDSPSVESSPEHADSPSGQSSVASSPERVISPRRTPSPVKQTLPVSSPTKSVASSPPKSAAFAGANPLFSIPVVAAIEADPDFKVCSPDRKSPVVSTPSPVVDTHPPVVVDADVVPAPPPVVATPSPVVAVVEDEEDVVVVEKEDKIVVEKAEEVVIEEDEVVVQKVETSGLDSLAAAIDDALSSCGSPPLNHDDGEEGMEPAASEVVDENVEKAEGMFGGFGLGGGKNDGGSGLFGSSQVIFWG